MNIHESTTATLPHIGESAKFVTLEHIESLGVSYVIAVADWNNLTEEVRTELLKVLNNDE